MPRALVPLAAGFEELEAVTIVNVLRRGGVEVVLAGLEGPGACVGARGMTLTPDVSFPKAQGPWDLIVLPGGGDGTDRMLAHKGLLYSLGQYVEAGGFVAAICAAPRVLDAIGALHDTAYTCHPSVAHLIHTGEHRDDAVVDAGTIVTSRSAGTALFFALHLLLRLTDAQTRATVEAGLAMR